MITEFLLLVAAAAGFMTLIYGLLDGFDRYLVGMFIYWFVGLGASALLVPWAITGVFPL